MRGFALRKMKHANEQLIRYRDCTITTRCVEVAEVARRTSRNGDSEAVARSFTASFSVEQDSGSRAWQEFPARVFRSSIRATENALSVAKESVDHEKLKR